MRHDATVALGHMGSLGHVPHVLFEDVVRKRGSQFGGAFPVSGSTGANGTRAKALEATLDALARGWDLQRKARLILGELRVMAELENDGLPGADVARPWQDREPQD